MLFLKLYQQFDHKTQVYLMSQLETDPSHIWKLHVLSIY